MKFLLSLLAMTALSFASIHAQSGDPLPAFPGQIVCTATTPDNGTNEIQTITIGGTPTAGTFTLTFLGKTTTAITWSATNATLVSRIDSALEALATIGTSGVTTAVGTMTAGIGTITVTFIGNNAKLSVATMTSASSLTGTSPTLAVTETTPGVTADGRKSHTGQLLISKDVGYLYQNTSTTSLQPAWTRIYH